MARTAQSLQAHQSYSPPHENTNARCHNTVDQWHGRPRAAATTRETHDDQAGPDKSHFQSSSDRALHRVNHSMHEGGINAAVKHWALLNVILMRVLAGRTGAECRTTGVRPAPAATRDGRGRSTPQTWHHDACEAGGPAQGPLPVQCTSRYRRGQKGAAKGSCAVARKPFLQRASARALARPSPLQRPPPRCKAFEGFLLASPPPSPLTSQAPAATQLHAVASTPRRAAKRWQPTTARPQSHLNSQPGLRLQQPWFL